MWQALWAILDDWGLCLPDSQSGIKGRTFSSEWHFHEQSSQDFFSPKGLMFFVIFHPAQPTKTYITIAE